MSRIGKTPVVVPKGVKVTIDNNRVSVTGPKGTLEREVMDGVVVELTDGFLIVKADGQSRRMIAFSGLYRSLLNNMVVGVDQGFKKQLAIEGVGYKADLQGSKLVLNVGYSNPVEFPLPKGMTAEVGKDNVITLESFDKELLGQTAARIRQVRKPEPYKGKGIRYIDEHIVRKVGKSAKK